MTTQQQSPSRRKRCWAFWTLLAFLLLILQEGSNIHPDDWFPRQAGVFVAGRYFDFIAWELNAATLKVAQAAAHSQWQLDDAQRRQLVLDYLDAMRQAHDLAWRIAQQYATLTGPELAKAVAPLETELAAITSHQTPQQPIVEAILEEQVTSVLSDAGFAPAGLLFPPVRFHLTQTPLYLIVSPRDQIETKYGTLLRADLPLEAQVALEEAIDVALDVSSLIEGVGGLGIYPTMIVEVAWLPWIVDTIAHEWAHNYLFLRPLGWHYLDSGQLTTINETVASIMGQEIGQAVLARYYPELAQRSIKRRHNLNWQPPPQDPAAFDFAREMRQTRLRVDEMLAAGQVEQAEAYMEAQRRIFVAQGYRNLRKLNQAYFAFHGSYAISPSSVDPIGPLLKRLRLRHTSLKDFVATVQDITTFADLERILKESAK